jgi:hypothetical protein
VPDWIARVSEEAPGIPACLVQNKIDLQGTNEAMVSQAEADALAAHYGLPLFNTSVAHNIAVDQVFHHLATAYIAAQTEDAAEATQQYTFGSTTAAASAQPTGQSKPPVTGSVKLSAQSGVAGTATKKKPFSCM